MRRHRGAGFVALAIVASAAMRVGAAQVSGPGAQAAGVVSQQGGLSSQQAGLSSQQAGLSSQQAGLSSQQASGGLKEALSRGVSTAVASTGKPGGYFDNPAIKILMPEKLRTVEKGLRGMGMGAKVDELEKSMNTAAEQAAPAAKPILMDALKSMTFDDARQIVAGGNTAGTMYFKKTSSDKIAGAFKPIVDDSMAKAGVTERLQEVMANAPSMPFMKTPTVDINGYVLQKAVDGLFVVMGTEETKIRTNPAAQVTPLLKSVFGR